MSGFDPLPPGGGLHYYANLGFAMAADQIRISADIHGVSGCTAVCVQNEEPK